MKFVTVKLKTAIASLAVFLVLMTVAGVALQRKTVPISTAEKDFPICRVERSDSRLALTFDAAFSAEYTEQLIEALGDTKATFFLSGTFVGAHPETVRQLHEAGHQLGIAFDFAPDNTVRTPEEFRLALQHCGDAIVQLTGNRPTVCRTPYGNYNQAVLSQIRADGYRCIGWEVDTGDWKHPSPDVLTKYTVSQAKPGSILLFHADSEATVKALPEILRRLRENGMEPVILSELLHPEPASVTGDGTQIGSAG